MKLVVLDRDGVINEDSDDYIKSPDEWHAIPGSLKAIATLNQKGYTVIVISNQSGIGRGYYDLQTLHAIHQKMKNELNKVSGEIDRIYFCPHTPDDHCNCRKPKTGLFEQLANDYHIDLHDVIAIGDSFRDIQAAQKVGCHPILVLTGKGKKTLEEHPELAQIEVFDDLAQAVSYLENK